ncbi:PTS beta-glucoside transporter subunit IIABC [Leuconostoc holzapfelii]|uniref:PTS beta-glucoside transporter subunit IIABC n=1 Tax=Leuconostoc holzapfelii TaxID=434464 RepID=A0ABT2NY98_9LACO|nr:beta-glucoside-specific PTS transporter subunit IIABC [Leuconostoc holzapfelii]MCT8388942.1 PTS beta-glucoside transporter subunit IIABC [Leuconostoc holzapfelii]
MAKYTELAEDILAHVGGSENVSGLRHCVTRLRFNLKDESLADTEYLQQRDGVVTVVKAGGQYQVVIGNQVPDVYDEVVKVGHLPVGGNTADTEETTAPQGNWFDRFIDVVSNLFQPILGALAAAGILKGITAILAATGMPKNDSVYIVMTAIGDGLFQYLPILLAVTAANKFKMNVYTALAIAGALVYPGLPQLLASAKPFMGLTIQLPTGGYYSTVLPIILAIYVASKIERFMKRHTHDNVKMFFVPMVTIFVTLWLTFLVVGPIANIASDGVGAFFVAIYNMSPILYGFAMGAGWQILVMFGLHWGIVPLIITQIATMGYSPLMAAAALPNFTQTGVLTGVLVKTKEKKVKTGIIPTIISSIFGVTEPAIYGYSLPMKTPFIVSIISSGIVGAYLGYFKVLTYINGGLGIFMYPSYIGPNGNLTGVMHMIIGTILAIVLGFVGMMFVKVPKLYDKSVPAVATSGDQGTSAQVELQSETIKSPLAGKAVALADVADEVFASGAMGQGIAIDPSQGEIVAPTAGEVKILFPTKHAIGFVTENGAELLIHIGMNTVELNGQHFTAHVAQGDHVQAGQKLVSFDVAAIQAAGYPVVTPVIVTNSPQYVAIETTDAPTVTTASDLIFLKK